MSLTNQAILQMLTPEREEELLQMLISKRGFYVVVKETEDFHGIMGVYLSIDEAVQALIKDASEICSRDWKDFNDAVIRRITWNRSFRPAGYGADWFIYDFPIESQKNENK